MSTDDVPMTVVERCPRCGADLPPGGVSECPCCRTKLARPWSPGISDTGSSPIPPWLAQQFYGYEYRSPLTFFGLRLPNCDGCGMIDRGCYPAGSRLRRRGSHAIADHQ